MSSAATRRSRCRGLRGSSNASASASDAPAKASTAHAFVTAFGKGFQRPLVLLRTLMAEMSEIASGPIQIAPWCCPRMTRPEATLLEAIARVRSNPPAARMLLADLLGVRDASGTAAIAHALADAFADLALPLDV